MSRCVCGLCSQINARTELALRYNDISPLENHHCSVAFEILANKDVNILAHLDNDTFRRVREGMIRSVKYISVLVHCCKVQSTVAIG